MLFKYRDKHYNVIPCTYYMICNCSFNTLYNALSGSNHIYPIAVIHTNCNYTYSACDNYMHLANGWLIVVQYEQYSVF